MAYDKKYRQRVLEYITLYQVKNTGMAASFYTPYYAFVDAVTASVNQYNADTGTYAYSTKTQRGGAVKTLGLPEPFFTSTEFMENGTDFLGLYEIYSLPKPIDNGYSIFNSSQVQSMQATQWCNANIPQEEVRRRIDKINEYARSYIAENKELFGKVTDETFIKSFALDLAMYHTSGVLYSRAVQSCHNGS